MAQTAILLKHRVTPWDWLRGAFGGFVAGMAMGLFMIFGMPGPTLEVAIPNMYGIPATPDDPAPLAGWFFHQYHAVFLGLVYVAYAEYPRVSGWIDARTYRGALAHGIICGILITALLPVLVMPVWLQAVGFPMAPPFPNISFPGSLLSLIGHLIYTISLALIYALYRRRM